MIKTLNDTRTIANLAVSCCFSLAHGWHDTHVVHVSSGNVVHIAVLVKYTLVSQITRVTRRFTYRPRALGFITPVFYALFPMTSKLHLYLNTVVK